jgi:hypothetical protein
MKNILIILSIVLSMIVGGWICAYPYANDPKSLGYLLWKLGLYNISIEDAVCAMIGDASREDIIIGKTKNEIEKRFGGLIASQTLPDYLFNQHNLLKLPSDEICLIRDSPWIILFRNGKAANLILVKGEPLGHF